MTYEENAHGGLTMSRLIWYKLRRLGFGVIGGICAAVSAKRIVHALGRMPMKVTLGAHGSADMPFDFNRTKTTQAVAFLLKQSPRGRESYMKIIKELYIADRESLKETGRPITGDMFVAMKQGPVLSHVLNLIKGAHAESPEWSRFIQKRVWDIELVADPGIGKLCRYEMDKLAEVWKRYKDCNRWRMVNVTHAFPEWQKNNPGRSVKPIPLSDVLEALGLADQEEEILRDARECRELSSLFGN
jgi:uncharacterized phage-associated protein